MLKVNLLKLRQKMVMKEMEVRLLPKMGAMFCKSKIWCELNLNFTRYLRLARLLKDKNQVSCLHFLHDHFFIFNEKM